MGESPDDICTEPSPIDVDTRARSVPMRAPAGGREVQHGLDARPSCANPPAAGRR